MKIEKVISISLLVAIISLHGIQLILDFIPSPTHAGWVNDIYVKDDVAYIADSEYGLVVMDVSNPLEPFELGRLNESYGSQIYACNNLAYLIGDGKLKIIDVTNPSSPIKVNEFDASGSRIGGMFVKFPLFYFYSGEKFWIYNLSNPLSPSQLSYIDVSDSYTIYDTYVSNNIAYIASHNGLKTIDVSNSSNPTELGHFGEDDCYDCVIEGNIAYIITGFPCHADILDVSDPSNPSKIGQFDEGGTSYLFGIDVINDTLYVFDLSDGLELIDVSDPLKPFKYAQFQVSENAYNIYIDFPNAYLICGEDGLLIIDISNPTIWNQIPSFLNFIISFVSLGVIVSLILLKLRIQKTKA